MCFFSETPSQVQRRNVSSIISNTDDGKKRVQIQCQLLDGRVSFLVDCMFQTKTIYRTCMLKVLSHQAYIYPSSFTGHLYMLNWIHLCKHLKIFSYPDGSCGALCYSNPNISQRILTHAGICVHICVLIFCSTSM